MLQHNVTGTGSGAGPENTEKPTRGAADQTADADQTAVQTRAVSVDVAEVLRAHMGDADLNFLSQLGAFGGLALVSDSAKSNSKARAVGGGSGVVLAFPDCEELIDEEEFLVNISMYCARSKGLDWAACGPSAAANSATASRDCFAELEM